MQAWGCGIFIHSRAAREAWKEAAGGLAGAAHQFTSSTTMSQDEALPVSVVALRAEGYSADGKSVVISLRTKFSSAERKYLVPIECFHDLIVDLQRLNASKVNELAEPLLPLEGPTIAVE